MLTSQCGAEREMQDNFNKTTFCKLCLNIINCSKFKVIEEVAKEILETVLPSLNLEENQRHLMCTACSSKLFAAFNFKATCMNTQDIIFHYINASNELQIELKEVYLKSNENVKLIDMPENQRICRFCLQLVTYGFVSLSEVNNDIINTYIPQLNVNATKNPVVCGPCFTSLCTHGDYLKNCLKVQEIHKSANTHQYIKTKQAEIKIEYGHDVQEDHKINDGQLYIKSEEIEIKTENGDTKQDNDTFSHNLDEDTVKNKEHISDVKDEMKNETEIQMNECKSLLDVSLCKSTYKGKFDDDLKHKNVLKLKYNCHEGCYKSKSKAALKRHHLTHKDPFEILMYKCDICTYTTKYRHHLKFHELTHKDPSDIQMYKCAFCTYETKYKRTLKIHQLTHKDPSEIKMYKCIVCKYETKYKSSLTKHQLIHTDPSEVPTYTCDACDYETKDKAYLKNHQLKHKHPSEIQMYRCHTCDYEAKRKGDLKVHQLVHKSSSDIKMYECDTCSYVTTYKQSLKKHQLVHANQLKDGHDVQEEYINSDDQFYIKSEKIEIKPEKEDQDNDTFSHNLYEETVANKKHISENIRETKDEYMPKYESEIQLKECETLLDISPCRNRYKTMYEDDLNHKIVAKMKYNCNECYTKSISKSALKRHQLIHKNPSEVQMYQCSICTYTTKYKHSLKAHELKHRNSSEIPMYKCVFCTYETKYKRTLITHQLTHKDPSELQMYKCDTCTFETKYKHTLKIHQLTHKEPSEIQMYKCDFCTHETKYKTALKRHQLIHTHPSEVSKYACNAYDHKTKDKDYLRNHKLKHKRSSEICMYRCGACNYEAKSKDELKVHQSVHKCSSDADIKMYECDICSYVTRYKQGLKEHQLLHANQSEDGHDAHEEYTNNGDQFYFKSEEMEIKTEKGDQD